MRCAVRMVTCRYYCFGFGWGAFDRFGAEAVALRDCCDRLRYAGRNRGEWCITVRTYAGAKTNACACPRHRCALVGAWARRCVLCGSTSSSGHCSATAELALSTCAGRAEAFAAYSTVGGAPVGPVSGNTQRRIDVHSMQDNAQRGCSPLTACLQPAFRARSLTEGLTTDSRTTRYT